MRSCLRFHVTCGFLVSVLFLAPMTTSAQQLTGPGSAVLDPLFQKVLKNPIAPDINLAFAQRAIALGDFEAAIATMERLLMVKSDLPLIRLELGMLYSQLGATSQAQAYLDQALESPRLPKAARKRAEKVRAAVVKAGRSFNFAYYLSAGIKHQSNANSGPYNARIDWPGDLPVFLDDDDLKKSDSQHFLSASAHFALDLPGLGKNKLNISLTAFTTQQNRLKSLNIDFYALQANTFFDIGGAYNLSLIPFIKADILNVSDLESYAKTYAAGMTVNGTFKKVYPVSVTAQFGYRKHRNQVGSNANSRQDGGRHTMNASVGRNLADGSYVGVSTNYRLAEARSGSDDKANKAFGFNLSYRRNLAAVSRWVKRPILMIAGVGYQKTKYQGADLIVHPEKTRRDNDSKANFGLIVAMHSTTQLLLQYNHINRTSNILKNNYKDNAITLTITHRF